MNIEKVKPYGGNILIKAYEWPNKSEGGILFPDVMRYRASRGGRDPWRGRVISIGDKVTQVKPGDIVRYQPDNYDKYTYEQDYRRYIFLNELLIYSVEDENENPIRALKNRVVYYPDETLKEKYGSVYLPQVREEAHLYGTIILVGPNSDVSVGDRVIISNKSTWQYFSSNGKRYILTDRFNLLGQVFSYCECTEPVKSVAGTMRDGSELNVCNICKGIIKT